MKRNARALLFGALVSLCTANAQTAANAKDFPQTTAAATYSMEHGFTKRTLVISRRFGLAPAAKIATTLASAVCASDCARYVTVSAGDVRSSGRDWQLEVSRDGTSARYENLALERRVMLLAKDPSQEIPAATLETLGRNAIASALRTAVTLAPNEELLPLRTDYLTGGAQDLRTRKIAHYVLANRIVFGRRLDGIPVVGGGSRVVLTFANNGALESFRYDWPRYRSSGSATAALLSQIVGRVNVVLGARFGGGRVPASAPKRSTLTRTGSSAKKSSTLLEKLECGYFDPGNASYRVGSTIQPGCVYHVVTRDAAGFREGYAGTVPGATIFARDGAWSESMILGTQR